MTGQTNKIKVPTKELIKVHMNLIMVRFIMDSGLQMAKEMVRELNYGKMEANM